MKVQILQYVFKNKKIMLYITILTIKLVGVKINTINILPTPTIIMYSVSYFLISILFLLGNISVIAYTIFIELLTTLGIIDYSFIKHIAENPQKLQYFLVEIDTNFSNFSSINIEDPLYFEKNNIVENGNFKENNSFFHKNIIILLTISLMLTVYINQ